MIQHKNAIPILKKILSKDKSAFKDDNTIISMSTHVQYGRGADLPFFMRFGHGLCWYR